MPVNLAAVIPLLRQPVFFHVREGGPGEIRDAAAVNRGADDKDDNGADNQPFEVRKGIHVDKAGCRIQEIKCKYDLPQIDDQHHDDHAGPPAEHPCDGMTRQSVFSHQENCDFDEVYQNGAQKVIGEAVEE